MTTGFKSAMTALSIAVAAAAFSGCASTPTYDQQRPDISSINKGDKGLQSKDLVQMTDEMGSSILKIPEIAQNPTRVVVVMKPPENKLASSPGEDLTIFVARIRGNLNKYARDRMLFVEEKLTTEKLQGAEGASNPDIFGEGSRGAPQAPTRYVPQYALYGTFYDKVNNATTYYLCTFRMTEIKTGAVVWEDQYEVRVGN